MSSNSPGNDNVPSLTSRLEDKQREIAYERDREQRGGNNGGNGGEPPMSDLTARVERLEDDARDIKVILARMEGRFDTLDTKFDALDHRFDAINTKLDTFATKADLSETKVSMIQWAVGTVIAAGALVFAIMRFFPAG